MFWMFLSAQHFFNVFFSKSKWLEGFQSYCFLVWSTFFTCSKPYVMSAAMALDDMISLSSGVWITLNSNFFLGFLSYRNTMCEHLVHVIIFVGIKWSPEMGENKLNLQIPKPSVTGGILSNNESFWSDLISVKCCNLAKMWWFLHVLLTYHRFAQARYLLWKNGFWNISLLLLTLYYALHAKCAHFSTFFL